MRIAIIDNYDSFTWNLVHLVKELGAQTCVLRNDRFDPEALEPFDKLLLSPGPGIPSEAGLLPEVIRRYAASKPILGICLGEQALGEAFGGTLINLEEVFHGVQTPCRRTADDYLFAGLPDEFPAGRYHSWVVDAATLPDCLECIAVSPEGQVMGLRHRSLDLRGLQFHPESVLTPDGATIISNWLNH
jgi:anthranilate synthase component 2